MEIREGKLIKGPFEPFEIDIILEEGQVFDIDDGLQCQVFATPGHTRDMLSYYIPEKKILIATESAGCLGRMVILSASFSLIMTRILKH